MTQIQPFRFEGAQVRTLVGDDGEPRFVGADVLAILDVDRTAYRRLDDDERGVARIHTPGGEQEVGVVTESGLYSLILGSRKPEAKTFKRWVTHEVLPAIRKTGQYGMAPALTEDQIVAQALQITSQRVRQLEAKVAADAPKVVFADAVATSQTDILVGDLAKILKGNGYDTGAVRLFARLRADGYLIKRQGTDYNMPTQRAMELGLFRVKETAVTHSDGHVTINKTPKVTGKGQAYFVNRYTGPSADEVAA